MKELFFAELGYKLKFRIGTAAIAFGFVILANLFPLLTKHAVAESQKYSHAKKLSLIRQLIKIRVQNDQLLKKKYGGENVPNVDDLPEIIIMVLPEATIVTIVESYWMMKNTTKKTERDILDGIENHRKTLFPESGSLPSPLTLSNYVKYRLNLEHSGGVPISNKFIEDAIKMANEAYR